ncbi:hypothetical protein [Gemmatimonas sp.]|uniref:hypothetical protein n=1 Tax=Gemmatimonas sp. TaxID=1962908 RepID=UPI003DA4796B
MGSATSSRWKATRSSCCARGIDEGRLFDTIVGGSAGVSPKTRGALDGALRGYKDINLQAMKLLAPGGLLFTASCSFHLSRGMFFEMLSEAVG